MRKGKTFKQQEKYYEVDGYICEYLISVILNGNFEDHDKMVKELSKEYRKDYLRYILTLGNYDFKEDLINRVINLI